MANVLVVDNEPIVRDVVGNLLENLGHRVWKAGNARDAFVVLGGPGHFDLVVVDLVLPGTSGFELIKQIRDKRPSIPIIVISGYIRSESTSAIEALHKVGITEVLGKPVDPLYLNIAVTNALRARR